MLIAETLDTVSDLNARARNDRRLSLRRGWVKNGDRWIVTATNNYGSLTARREKSKWRTTITLPATYVATDLELG